MKIVVKNLVENSVLIKESFDFLYLNQRLLTAGQTDFVESLKKYYRNNKQLSENQLSALLGIRKYLKVDGQVRITNNG